MDDASSATFTGSGGRLYRVGDGAGPATSLTTGGSRTKVTTDTAHGGPVTVTPLPLAVVPARHGHRRVPAGARAYEARVAAGTAGTDLAFTATGLTAGARYRLTAGGGTVASGTADSKGALTLRARPAGTAAVDYRVTAV
ncbi:hypothetical protein NKH77_53345 [Streptomyces sp. M19]